MQLSLKLFFQPLRFSLVLLAPLALGQMPVKKLNDPSIVSMQKRRVFESWGEFSPYPKYLLGVQTNLAYATVWGMWSPERNRTYRKGRDLRPLGPSGEETQRQLLQRAGEKSSLLISLAADSLSQVSLKELSQVLPVTLKADPLYLLYYKPMLRPLKDCPVEPFAPKDWDLSPGLNLQLFKREGRHLPLQEKLLVLKDRLELSENSLMKKGERLLLQHHLLLSFRKLKKEMHYAALTFSLAHRADQKLKEAKENSSTLDKYSRRSDKEIVQGILSYFKSKEL